MALPPPAAGMMAPDPAAGAGADAGADPTAGGDDSGGDNVVVTITKTGDGSYMVYAGDEPDQDDGADMSEDDADAMGAAGAAPAPNGGAAAPQGVPADSVGAALKAALDILKADASSEGAPGSADDQFAGGFSADKSPTPASGGGPQKY